MRRIPRRARLVTLLSAGAILLAACGSDSDDAVESSDTAAEATETTAEAAPEATEAPTEETVVEETDETDAAPAAGETGSGGEFIDGAQFGAAKPPHIDPAFTSELDGAQVSWALYDGLTDFSNGPDGPELRPLVAESWEANADATQFVFTIKEGLTFSNGEAVLPSSFVRGWNRAADPNLATDYSYLFGLVAGYNEWAEDPVGITSMSGVVGDDEAMTLTVDLSASYADFPSVASHTIFSPMPEAVEELADQTEWEQGIMIGNGPFMMESPLTDSDLVLVPNPEWAGDVDGNTTVLPSKVTFVIAADIDSAYAAFEAGETMSATIPSGRFTEANEKYDSTASPLLGSYHFVFGMRDDRSARRCGERPAAQGDPGCDQPDRDQRCRLRRFPHRVDQCDAPGHPWLRRESVRELRRRHRSGPGTRRRVRRRRWRDPRRDQAHLQRRRWS